MRHLVELANGEFIDVTMLDEFGNETEDRLVARTLVYGEADRWYAADVPPLDYIYGVH